MFSLHKDDVPSACSVHGDQKRAAESQELALESILGCHVVLGIEARSREEQPELLAAAPFFLPWSYFSDRKEILFAMTLHRSVLVNRIDPDVKMILHQF